MVRVRGWTAPRRIHRNLWTLHESAGVLEAPTIVGIETRLKDFYTRTRGAAYWDAHRDELLDFVISRTGARQAKKEFNHETRRDMMRHPLLYPWIDLIRSRVKDELLDNSERRSRLGPEELYYLETGEHMPKTAYGMFDPSWFAWLWA